MIFCTPQLYPPHSPPFNDLMNVGCVYRLYHIGCQIVLWVDSFLLSLMLDVGERKKKKTPNPIYCIDITYVYTRG